ncbi:MAG: hypothetical protein AB1656_18825 [Candidatus Omnitrophota bacterium]
MAERVCVICGGPMGKQTGDICCKEEDAALLISCKGNLRNFKDRQCGIDDITEYLYEDLANFLRERDDNIDNYDYEGVIRELTLRVLRWINLKMIDFKNVSGIGYCSSCGVLILAGRTKCSNCMGMSEIKGAGKPSLSSDSPKKPKIGMYIKR